MHLGDQGDPPSFVRCVRGSIPLLITAPHGGSDAGAPSCKHSHSSPAHAHVNKLQLFSLSFSGKLGELQVDEVMSSRFVASFGSSSALNLKIQARVFMEREAPTGTCPPPTTPPLVLCLPVSHVSRRHVSQIHQVFKGETTRSFSIRTAPGLPHASSFTCLTGSRQRQ